MTHAIASPESASDEAFLDNLRWRTFDYIWETTPADKSGFPVPQPPSAFSRRTVT